MEINDVIKTKEGNYYTVQRTAKLGPKNLEYLVLYDIKTMDLEMAYVENNKVHFLTDQKEIMRIAEEFDKLGECNGKK